jgi:hypothetical protein
MAGRPSSLRKSSSKSQSKERRKHPRFDCPPDTIGFLIGDLEGDPWPIIIRNISRSGLGLLIGRRIDVDRVVIVDMRAASNKYKCRIPARVVYSTGPSRGQNILGCKFLRLISEEEVKKWR